MTLGVALLLSCTAGWVGMQRLRLGIKAPEMTRVEPGDPRGDEMFKRAYRIQMNTQEGALVFLPALWICAFGWSDQLAGALGGIWIAARVWYALAYAADPTSRRSAFLLSQTIYVVTWLGGAAGLVLAALRV
ncbi:MAG: MAPEG family protein [Betaproteobacteria bacterium]|nr:MAPEG family protein [Betaproteobacteria bacterium]